MLIGWLWLFAYGAGRAGWRAWGPAARYAVTDLGALGGGEAFATNLNDRGQVVGYSKNEAGDDRAFLWPDPREAGAGRMADLGTLGGRYSFDFGVSSDGRVVGY
jgi:probable HAF family extracellular repeat protein